VRSLCALLITLFGVVVLAQIPEPRFDVVSIKRNTTGSGGSSAGTRPDGTWYMTNGSVVALLHSAFTIKNPEIVGLPDWATSERYDVIATVTARPSRDQEAVMLRELLADRFTYRGHMEPREQGVFALVVARPERPLPSSLQRLSVSCAELDAARRRGETVTPEPLANGERPCGYSMNGGAQLVLTSRGITMSRLADSISNAAGRVVIDHTGLAGDYAFTLTYDLPRTAGTVTDTPTVFTALVEQLGLKLEPARAAVDTLVIDHIERPAEN
jgi:uncharacterized protein (TIGR03435 family)